MIQLTHASISFPPKNVLRRLKAVFEKNLQPENEKALDDITLWIGNGESFAVIGERHAGKTTLLRLIAKHMPPDTGGCIVRGRVASSITGHDALCDDMTGAQNTTRMLEAAGVPQDKIAASVIEAAKLFQDDALFERETGDYAYPDRMKLSVAIALATKPDVLVIGNSLEEVDKPSQQQFMIEIRRMVRDGMTLIIASEDEEILTRLCDSAIWLKAGRIHKLGLFEDTQAARRFFTGKPGIRRLGEVAFSEEIKPGKSERRE